MSERAGLVMVEKLSQAVANLGDVRRLVKRIEAGRDATRARTPEHRAPPGRDRWPYTRTPRASLTGIGLARPVRCLK